MNSIWFYFWLWENFTRGNLTLQIHLFLSFLGLWPDSWVFLLNSLSSLPPTRGSGSSELSSFLPYGTSLGFLVSVDGTTELPEAETQESPSVLPLLSTLHPFPLPTHKWHTFFRLQACWCPLSLLAKAAVISCLGLLWQQSVAGQPAFHLCSDPIYFVHCCQWSL